MSLLNDIDTEGLLATYGVANTDPRTATEAFAVSLLDTFETVTPAADIFNKWKESKSSFDKIKEITGKAPFEAAGISPKGYDFNIDYTDTIDKWIVGQRETDPRFNDVKTSTEIEENRTDYLKGLRSEKRELEDVRPYSSFAGAVAGNFYDPLNVATMFIPVGKASLTLKAAYEALINSGVEAAEVPWRSYIAERLGEEYGLKEAAIDISAGAVLGAAIPAIGGVLGAAGRKLKDIGQYTSDKFFPKKALDLETVSFKDVDPEVNQAATVLSRAEHVDEMIPVENPTIDDILIHRANAQEFNDAMNEGRQPILKLFDGQEDAPNLLFKEPITKIDEKAVKLLEMTPEHKAATEAEFYRRLKETPDEKIDIDGEDITIGELKQRLDDEQTVLNAINGCAV